MMSLESVIKRAMIEGYATNKIGLATIGMCFVCTVVIAVYICIIYRLITKNTFYNKTFNLSLLIIALVTSAIILTIQSNIVVSLGMVGALSIVRFRTAIKDPMDLAFLFWAVSVGIICGAGFAFIAVVVSLLVTISIILFERKSVSKGKLMLVVDADPGVQEERLLEVIKRHTSYSRVRARNASKNGLNIAVEILSESPAGLTEELMAMDGIDHVSVIEKD